MKAEKKHSGWSTARIRAAALIVVAVLAGYFAVRLAFAPGMEQRRMQENQTALLDSIRQGDGALEMNSEELLMNNYGNDWYLPSPDGEAERDIIISPISSGLPESGESSETDNYSLFTNHYQLMGIGILTIDSIDLELPVAEGVSDAQLKIAVGHVPGTAAVGDIGNAVIAGHRSYTLGEHFNRLGEVEIGDLIQYKGIDGENMVFVVDEILETVPGDQSAFTQPNDKSQLTLYTCTPIRTATHRLIIRASRII